MSRYVYPSIPEHATKDFYEMVDPLDLVEINCRCKHDENGNLVECESCKQYFGVQITDHDWELIREMKEAMGERD